MNASPKTRNSVVLAIVAFVAGCSTVAANPSLNKDDAKFIGSNSIDADVETNNIVRSECAATTVGAVVRVYIEDGILRHLPDGQFFPTGICREKACATWTDPLQTPADGAHADENPSVDERSISETNRYAVPSETYIWRTPLDVDLRGIWSKVPRGKNILLKIILDDPAITFLAPHGTNSKAFDPNDTSHAVRSSDNDKEHEIYSHGLFICRQRLDSDNRINPNAPNQPQPRVLKLVMVNPTSNQVANEIPATGHVFSSLNIGLLVKLNPAADHSPLYLPIFIDPHYWQR